MSEKDQALKHDYIAALREDRVNHRTGGDRPLSPLGGGDVIIKVRKLAEFFLANAEEVNDRDRKFCENIEDELRWTNNRFHIYEHALLGLKVLDKNNVELAQLLDGRSEVLYRLFGVGREELPNEAIMEVLKHSGDPRVTDGLYFPMSHHRAVIHYPSLMKEFLDKVDQWQDDREKIEKAIPDQEPEMLKIDFEEPRGDDRGQPNRRTRRYIRREWTEWYQYKHGNTGRGVSFEEVLQKAVDILVNQLFPEGKPVDIQVKVDSYARHPEGYEVEIRRMIHNVEYF